MAITYKNPNENFFQPGQGGNPIGGAIAGAPIPNTAPNNAVITPTNTSGQNIPVADLNSFGQANPGLSFTAEDLPSYNNATKPNTYQGNSIVDALSQGGQASDFASRTKLAQTYGIQGYTGSAQQNTELLQKYRQGLQTAQSSGTTAPTSSSGGTAAVKSMIPPPTTLPEANPMDAILAQDKGYQQLQKDYSDYKSSLSQQQTLQEQYKQMETESGLPALKTEAMNMKNVIEGTESDIRNEITKAGGFATESQVLALTGARNKSLIQNYNKLTDQIANVQNHLDTMIGLSKEDKANALEQYKTQLDYDKTVADYTQKFTSNAVDAYNKVIDKAGYAGLYSATGGDPHTINLVEKTLGLAAGSLAQLATQKTDEWGTPYVLGGNYVQKNSKTGEIRTASSIPSKTGTGSIGVSGTLSQATQAVITNPSLFDDLTPTVKGQIIAELQANGYDTTNLGTKSLSDTAIKEISQTQSALSNLSDLKALIEDKSDLLGPITGLARFNPYSDAKKLQADVDRVRQVVGKALEGGVLRKEDEDKYKKILATLADTPSTAIYKIDALIGSITRDIDTYKSLQQSGGRSLDVNASLQKTESTPSQTDLRAKYNY